MTIKTFKLSFSGGGFRASFYCLGAYRRLVELGIDSHVSHISSVSGGSITAGAIMTALCDGGFTGINDFDARVSKPLRRLGQINLRHDISRRSLTPKLSNLSREFPRTRFARVFPIVLSEHIFDAKLMRELPTSPEWSCNATCLNTMKRFRFKSTDMYGYRLGTSHDLNDITVSLAVAASAAFPILFAPIRLSTNGRRFLDKYGSSDYTLTPPVLYLTDGGVYDNLGSESMLKDDAPFITLDASGTPKSWASTGRPNYFGLWWRLLSVSMSQTVSMRRRLLFNEKNGIQLLLDTPILKILESERNHRNPELPDYSFDAQQMSRIEPLLAGIRTDLDSFHDIEIDMLMWAGAVRMDLAIKSLFPHAVDSNLWHQVPPIPSYSLDRVEKVLTTGQSRKNIGTLHRDLHK